MSRPIQALIDLSALEHNLSVARRHAPRSRVMAVIPLEQVFGRAVEIAQVDSEGGVGTEVAAPVGVAFDAASGVAERPGVDGAHRRLP